MAVAVRDQHPNSERVSKHSLRLRKLTDEAAKVREMHERGEISSQEASKRLSELKVRYRGFFDRFL